MTAANRMVAVPILAGSGFAFGKPQQLFDAGAYYIARVSRSFDISADGKRFLMMLKEAAHINTPARPSIVVVSHWFDEVKAKMPAQR